ncbi:MULTISPECIES: lipid A export permease/ATP-binding protein MsbA [Marinobacter]|uniref:Lipid A export permease/ATP-binding protein MsbA n=1 Tax=Marinobacter xiaoshiensis TaxID=3073652 RepID=A0ABU2HGT2_9GAMM|nr:MULTISPECIES: lipid A export permease/ATP-binding protein MsbA [unclassified Marinobacter]MBK1885839.1 lipid A export permease/ATP-binding protein MsbA [Marinobacter sp. DY40_1A1]MDS1309830.1 lipid A export permease/ATP-binding protein MsbA [Marinobacter sp. F60267]
MSQAVPPTEPKPVKPGESWETYKRLLAYVKPFWLAFSLAVVGNIIYAAASTGMAAAMEYVIAAIENPTEQNRILLTALIIGMFTFRGIGTFLSQYFISYVGRQVINSLRTDVFNRLMTLPSRYFDENAAGRLVSKLTFNVEQVAEATTNAVTITLREGLTIVGLLSFMLYTNWKLTLIFLAVGPLIGAVVSYASKRFRKISQRIQGSMGDITHVASESITGYRVVRTFGGVEYEQQRFQKVNDRNLKQSLKMASTQAISVPVIQTLVAVAIAALVWTMLSPEIRGEMSTGQLVAFITAATTMAKPIRQVTSVHAQIQKGVAAAYDVFETIDEAPEQDPGTFAPERVEGNIEFDDMSFRYRDQLDNVLEGISVDIPAGQSVALVGRSGSGKSTLVSLLPRFYEYTGGDIRIDGHSLKDFSLKALRSQIALVTQNVVLFNDSIAANIAYGALRDCSREEIREAAAKAHALEFIDRMPEGLDTMIGDNGVMLSGGQRQRLAIARALLKDAPILILDEATSALDTESERHIQKALETVIQGRTTLVIAHRLSTIESADRILVMDNGRIVESGRHEELLAKKGAYAQLHQMQFSEHS